MGSNKVKHHQPPVEQPPVEQPPVEQPPVEQPPVEQPPVEQPPVEQPPVEQPPVEQPPVEQPPVEQPPVEQPPVENLYPDTESEAEALLATPVVRQLILENDTKAQNDLRNGPGGQGWENNEGARQRCEALAKFWAFLKEASDHYAK